MEASSSFLGPNERRAVVSDSLSSHDRGRPLPYPINSSECCVSDASHLPRLTGFTLSFLPYRFVKSYHDCNLRRIPTTLQNSNVVIFWLCLLQFRLLHFFSLRTDACDDDNLVLLLCRLKIRMMKLWRARKWWWPLSIDLQRLPLVKWIDWRSWGLRWSSKSMTMMVQKHCGKLMIESVK